MAKKFIIFLIILALIPFSLTGCYDTSGLETMAYVVAMGLDEGEDNVLKLTLQFAINGSGSGGQSVQSESTTITSIDCSSIDSGINLINSYISKRVNLTHCKILVISETLAEKGIEKYANTLANNVEVRPDCDLIISRCSASDFLSYSKPTLEKLTARYYEVLLTSKKYTGFTANSPLAEIDSFIHSSYGEPVAVLGGLNTPATTKNNSSTALVDTDSNYKADQSPVEDKTLVQNMGLAVFKQDRLVGELNGMECICYLILTNNLDNCTISVPSPFDYNETIDLYIYQHKSTKNTVKLLNGSPYISSEVSIRAVIRSSDVNADYSTEENIKAIEEYTSSYLEEHLSSYMYKTAKEFKSDITSFGKYIMPTFSTMQKWKNYNWLENYKNSFFDVKVSTNIKSGSLFIKH